MHRRTEPVLFRGLRSVARIFYPLFARKSSGFAQMNWCFCPKMPIWKKSWGFQPHAYGFMMGNQTGLHVHKPYTLCSVRCRVVRCCGFHDSSPSLHISSAALTASCSVIPVELLMSLSHDVGGRPLFFFPLTFPVMIVLSSPFLRITCSKNATLAFVPFLAA